MSWGCDEGGEEDWMSAFVHLGLSVENIRIVKAVILGIYTFCGSFRKVIGRKR
jgi:hypothetical protein